MKTKKNVYPIGRAVLSLAVGLGLLLGGCEEAAKPDTGSATQQLTYDGTTIEVPAKAQRILFAWTSFTLEDAMALDMKIPAVAQDGGAYGGVVAEYAKDAEKVDTSDPEAVRKYDPDAILMMALDNPEHVKELAGIAPVILSGGRDVDWTENLRMMAGLSGQKEKGEELIDQYNKKAAALKEKWNPDGGKTAVHLLLSDGSPGISAVPTALLPTLYEDLGFRDPLKAGEEAERWPSLDELAEADPDYLFLDAAELHEGTSEAELMEKLKQEASWSSLRAFREGHVYLGALLENGLSGTQSYSRLHMIGKLGEKMNGS
ncbi:ABC transporter substrate-binding protein [Saccharibacillus deserti]|uniref:ABC transporter substrate-binding protein n=1 Tax=Saccharibacillus deserti TaxID=1634444 RepID=UPI0015545B86|nr:ABC transporter substrate-binding protein [Saccharibacillus deserti]